MKTMKKILAMIAVVSASLFLSVPKASAQDQYFVAGDIKVDAYLGLSVMPWYHYSPFSFVPIGIGGEYGIVDFGDYAKYGTLSAGAVFEFGLNRYYDAYEEKSHFKPSFQTAAFGAYHYFVTNELDVHAKSGLAWNSYYHHLGYYGMAGASYFLGRPVAVTVEIGYMYGMRAQLGLSLVF